MCVIFNNRKDLVRDWEERLRKAEQLRLAREVRASRPRLVEDLRLRRDRSLAAFNVRLEAHYRTP